MRKRPDGIVADKSHAGCEDERVGHRAPSLARRERVPRGAATGGRRPLAGRRTIELDQPVTNARGFFEALAADQFIQHTLQAHDLSLALHVFGESVGQLALVQRGSSAAASAC